MEQALKSSTCSALGWLDPRHVTPQVLRRLQQPAAGHPRLSIPPERGPGGFPGRLRLRLEAGRNAQEVRLRSEGRGAGPWAFELALVTPKSAARPAAGDGLR